MWDDEVHLVIPHNIFVNIVTDKGTGELRPLALQQNLDTAPHHSIYYSRLKRMRD
jgi:hypothetical protein